MARKIFINYRREDTRADAARLRDRLAAAFGAQNVFMDVDNLMAGQRFDQELAKALNDCDVLLAVIGPHWERVLAERARSGGRDYVREEIAGALQRGIVVIPVLIERVPMPAIEALPEDIRSLVLHQKHDVSHERFGRDVTELVQAIKQMRAVHGKRRSPVKTFGIAAGALALAGAAVVGYVKWTQFEPAPRPAVVTERAPEHVAPEPAPAPLPAETHVTTPEPAPAPPEAEKQAAVPPAALSDPGTSAPPPAPAPIDTADLIRKIQDALRQAGCFNATSTGTWGPKTKSAVASFNQHAGKQIATDGPTEESLAAIGGATGVCPAEPAGPVIPAAVLEARAKEDMRSFDKAGVIPRGSRIAFSLLATPETAAMKQLTLDIVRDVNPVVSESGLTRVALATEHDVQIIVAHMWDEKQQRYWQFNQCVDRKTHEKTVVSVLKLNLEDYGIDVKDIGSDPEGRLRRKAVEHFRQLLTKAVQ